MTRAILNKPTLIRLPQEFSAHIFKMPGRGISVDLHKKSQSTVREYVANINANYLACNWHKGDWSQAHGDGKGNTHGIYTMSTMMSSGQPKEYLVKVECVKNPILRFALPGTSNGNGSISPPEAQEVLNALYTALEEIGQ